MHRLHNQSGTTLLTGWAVGTTGKQMDDCPWFQPYARKTKIIILTKNRIETLRLMAILETIIKSSIKNYLFRAKQNKADKLAAAV